VLIMILLSLKRYWRRSEVFFRLRTMIAKKKPPINVLTISQHCKQVVHNWCYYSLCFLSSTYLWATTLHKLTLLIFTFACLSTCRPYFSDAGTSTFSSHLFTLIYCCFIIVSQKLSNSSTIVWQMFKMNNKQKYFKLLYTFYYWLKGDTTL
jgi:hypothetical protein